MVEYSKLSDEAKRKAREWFISGDYPYDEWWDSTYDWFREVTKTMGFQVEEMRFSGFWSQGDGASWKGTWYPQAGMIKAVMDHTDDKDIHDIAIGLFYLQFTYGFKLNGVVEWLRCRNIHENTMTVELECEDREIGDDATEKFLELTRELARWLYHNLEREHEYLTSDEHVEDMIMCNDYQFTEDGELE